MKIICIKGGLGNQLFEYARYKRLKDKGEEKIFLFYDFRRVKQHGGVLLSKCFNLSLPPCPLTIFLLTLIIKFCRELHILHRLYDENKADSILIDDYSQDQQYISDIKQYLSFRQQTYGKEYDKIAHQIKSSEYPVAVHVRRGDYLHPSNINNIGVCDLCYFHQAIQKLSNVYPKRTLFVFSDDQQWVKENIKEEKIVYVELPDTIPDYAELQLMTLCKGHILSNSTFSFWGAYLADKTPQTMNIYPRQWYKNPEWEIPDIFPDDWIAV